MQATQSNTPNLDKLKMLINKRHGYTKAVKIEVLKQLDGLTSDISYDKYWEASGNIETVLKATTELLKRCKIINKQVLKLERHAYAPELNKVHLKNGATIAARGCTTIEQAVKHLAQTNFKYFA